MREPLCFESRRHGKTQLVKNSLSDVVLGASHFDSCLPSNAGIRDSGLISLTMTDTLVFNRPSGGASVIGGVGTRLTASRDGGERPPPF